jgi:hypothetical protein
MQVQLESLAREIKDLSEVLAFNGLNLVSQENIRQIEMFLQQASQLHAFRLATSLRYLHVELKRFMAHHPAFNVERYVFFLNNCWLLGSAFLSQGRLGKGSGEAHIAELLGKPSEPVNVAKMELRLAGLEKIHLEGALFGLIFHFVSKSGVFKDTLVKLSMLQQPKGLSNPEILLGMNIPGTDPPVPFYKLIKQDIIIKKVKFLEREAMIQMGTENLPEFVIPNQAADEQDPFPVELLEMHDLDVKKVIDQISTNPVTPFDSSVISAGYLHVKNVVITALRKEGDAQGYYQTSTQVFDITHDRGYPLHIRVQDKQVNNMLIDNMARAMKNSTHFKGMFGKLNIERGMLSLFPLACIEDSGVWFPCIARDMKLNNKDILQNLYQQKG